MMVVLVRSVVRNGGTHATLGLVYTCYCMRTRDESALRFFLLAGGGIIWLLHPIVLRVDTAL